MSTLLQTMHYVLAFTSAVLAVHLFLAKPARLAPSVLLGLTFLLIAAHAVLLNTTLQFGRQNLAGWLMPLQALCFGPLLYLTFRVARRPSSRVLAIDLLHFVPAIVIPSQILFGRHWLSIDASIVMSFLVYSGLLIKNILAGPRQFAHHEEQRGLMYRWLLAAGTVMCLAFISELLVLLELSRDGHLNASMTLMIAGVIKLIAIGILTLAALQHPSPFDWLRDLAVTDSSERRQHLSSIGAQFDTLVRERSLYKQDDISLKTVATHMGVPARELSKAINQTFNASFSKVMNEHRVATAKQLLTESPKRSIIHVMHESGFRTKSNFNKEFKAIEGVSPTQFRERGDKGVQPTSVSV